MAHDDSGRRDSVVGDVEFPATSGSATGWIGLALVVVGLFLTVGETSGVVVVRWVLGLLLLGVLFYAYLMRPRVRIRDDALVLVNPMSTTVVPLARISYVSVRSVTRVTVGEKRYSGVGVGRKVREMARPTGEGVVPSSAGMGTNILGSSSHLGTPMRTERGAVDTADMLEDSVARAVLQVRDATGRDPEQPVLRSLTTWLVVPSLVLLLALVVTLFL